MNLDPYSVPMNHPVQPLTTPSQIAVASKPTRCGTCGLTWDDALITSITPAPSARCPFEAFHVPEQEESPFWWMDLLAEHVPDLLRSIANGAVVPICSEEDGGIIAYALGESHADRIVNALREAE